VNSDPASTRLCSKEAAIRDIRARAWAFACHAKKKGGPAGGPQGRQAGRAGPPYGRAGKARGPFEELADKVLNGEVERAAGAVAGQLLNGARACVRDGLMAREQEELVERMEELETLQGRKAG
jgi:hypothetical protein